MLELIPIFFFIFISFLLACILVAASLIFGPSELTSEKVSVYECGFNPFEDSRKTFDVGFYVVGILFIIFDIEIVLLFPLVFTFFLLTSAEIVCFVYFLIILILGLFFEWKKGVLDWA